MKNIELHRSEWRSTDDGNEPFFGDGAPGWFAWCIGFALTLLISSYIRGG